MGLCYFHLVDSILHLKLLSPTVRSLLFTTQSFVLISLGSHRRIDKINVENGMHFILESMSLNTLGKSHFKKANI